MKKEDNTIQVPGEKYPMMPMVPTGKKPDPIEMTPPSPAKEPNQESPLLAGGAGISKAKSIRKRTVKAGEQ